MSTPKSRAAHASARTAKATPRDPLAVWDADGALRPSFEPVAYSADGREFKYEATLSADIAVGGWVTLETMAGVRYLGQITSEDIDVRDGHAIDGGTDGSGSEGQRRRIRSTNGSGVLLMRLTGRDLVATDGSDVFDAATIATADGATVARYLDASAGKRSRLAIGALERSEGSPNAFLRADGFDRHTFLCGQSGSGKTYALGLVLEQLVLQTSLRIVIIDPNSDFVKLNRVRKGVPQAAARAYRKRAQDLQVLRRASMAASGNVLRVWFSDLAEVEQAAALRLDPLADREEYAELSEIAETFGGRRYSLTDVLKRARASSEPAARQLALRISNLHVTDWAVWAKGSEKSSVEQLRASTRAAVIDIGTLTSQSAKYVTAANVIGNLWRSREQRRPTLIVIDEAHNVCPAEPTDALQANATKYCIDIAAEGRKFGLYLLLSTQRPQKLHPNVLSQCDNLMLMRMNSRADLAELSATFSAVPQTLIEESMRFKMGETLLAGKIVPTPLIARVGGRITEEGGADIPASWAESAKRR